ncbi:LPXTG cell wall anchor domain-containing protein [Microbacterium sp. ZW T5_56]|uniref:LPXTG cell wall anchor domain-containing protein n=1 Tax=Microbacterium sp. ZW T5_56 TaxID=3378081 RepID=UPI0038547DB3
MSARHARLIATAVIAWALAMSPVAAHAAPYPDADAGPLEVSHDGITFADGDETLFDAIERVVPGDRITESLWARSTATTAGRLGIELTDVVADDRSLARAISVTIRVDGALVGTLTLADADTACVMINDSTLLPPGGTARVDAELIVSDALGGESLPGGQDGSVGFGVRVTLTDVAMPARGPGPCRAVPAPTTQPGALPQTGAPSLAVLTILALGATVVGAVALWSRRTR